MISVFFDLDITLICAPTQKQLPSDFQNENLTLLNSYQFSNFPSGYSAIHLDFHRRIFSKMMNSSLFFPRIVTAGRYPPDAMMELMDKVFSVDEEFFFPGDRRKFIDHRNFFDVASFYNQSSWLDKYRTKGQLIKYYFDEKKEGQKKSWSDADKDIFDFQGPNPKQYWLIDDSPAQRASAEQFDFITFDPKSSVYPVLFDNAICSSSLSGMIKSFIPFLGKT